MTHTRCRSLLASLPLALLGAMCAEAPTPAAQPPAQAQPSAAPTDHGQFTLAQDGAVSQPSRSVAWSAPEGLVFCRWYAEPERGDYLWIRLAQTPAQDGDAGERLDIDVCRLSQRPRGAYAPMPAGAHGSHCGPEPGFAIWWHAGEHAYNNGTQADVEGCTLALEFDAQAMTLTGEFACAGLGPAAHGEPGELGSVDLAAGQFSCQVTNMPPDLDE